uniref:MIP02708p n=1 Tax=Drosophila melanogaster TaxID=7227 RepID=C0PTV1_DROME|nr:MIP02708p [Drosophila melanogaster]
MAFRGNQNRNRNFGGGNNNYGGPMGANRMGGMNMSPWESQNPGGGQFGNNMRQGGGQMNAQAINLANNLLNNLFRNQNPPSLLDLPRGGGGMGNRNQRGGPYAHLPIKSTTDRRLQLHHKAFNAFAIGCIPTSPIRLTENRLEYGIWTKSQCPKHMANELIPSFDKICKNKTAKTMPSKTIQTMQIRPA